MTPTLFPAPTATRQTLPLEDIVCDDQVQQRADFSMAKVYEYRDLYAEGRDLGALTVFQDDDGAVVPEGGPPIYTLADGFHRHHAAVLAGITELPCDVYRGNTRDAILYATSHNLHGQPLSNADK